MALQSSDFGDGSIKLEFVKSDNGKMATGIWGKLMHFGKHNRLGVDLNIVTLAGPDFWCYCC